MSHLAKGNQWQDRLLTPALKDAKNLELLYYQLLRDEELFLEEVDEFLEAVSYSALISPENKYNPSISIVTPVFNGERFIAETIRSVILQGYTNLEYFVIDGQSTDETLRAIEPYFKYIHKLISEPDRGQSHAINKGLLLSSGELFLWINADDYFSFNALNNIASVFRCNSKSVMIAGSVENFCKAGDLVNLVNPRAIVGNQVIRWWNGVSHCHQPGIAFRRDALLDVGCLDESYHYAMDFDLILRLVKLGTVSYADSRIAHFRIHDAQKTSKFLSRTANEKFRISFKHRNCYRLSLITLGFWFAAFQILIRLILIKRLFFRSAH